MNVSTVIELYWSLLWPLFVVLFVFAFLVILKTSLEDMVKKWGIRRRFEAGEKWRSDEDLKKWLSSLSYTEFEEQTAEMFRRWGYTVTLTGSSHDEGVDVELVKDGEKSIVQCKHYKNKVGRPELAKFYGDLVHHQVKKGYFVTTGIFTVEAEKYVEDKPIELIDGRKLVKYMREAKMGFGQNEEKCPQCGSVLIERDGKYGRFLGCSTYPICDFTKSL